MEETEIVKVREMYDQWGLCPIVLFPKSKVPVGERWQQRYTAAKFRGLARQFSNPNVGTLLGHVVDLEGDTDAANEMLHDLLKGTEHPIFYSKRSFHHLFLNPFPNFRFARSQGVEVRGYGHQSVLPPSTHPDGNIYKWVKICEIPHLPKEAIEWMQSCGLIPKQRSSKRLIYPWCGECGSQVGYDKPLFERELPVFKKMKVKWLCVGCRPRDFKQIYHTQRKARRNKKRQAISHNKKMKHYTYMPKHHQPINQVNCKAKSLQTRLLHKPGKGELEFAHICNHLKECYGKLFKYKQRKTFVEPSKGQYFYLDFYLYGFRLCVEIDGPSHNSKDQSAWDKWRTEILNQHKIRVERFSYKDVLYSPKKVCGDLIDYCLEQDCGASKGLLKRMDGNPKYVVTECLRSNWS